jgi:hypothetical protein
MWPVRGQRGVTGNITIIAVPPSATSTPGAVALIQYREYGHAAQRTDGETDAELRIGAIPSQWHLCLAIPRQEKHITVLSIPLGSQGSQLSRLCTAQDNVVPEMCASSCHFTVFCTSMWIGQVHRRAAHETIYNS